MDYDPHDPKVQIIKRFLFFVDTHYGPPPLVPSARLATLGGEGLEALIWKDIEIKENNGWLIECKRRLSRKLIRSSSFRYCSKLGAFPGMFQSVWGKGKGIDGFHLDLCGTFEPKDKDFAPAIPLIMRSRGKCLAITVADQRRNRSTENFGRVYADGEKLFGKDAASEFLRTLETEQRELIPSGFGFNSDPILGAEREFGFATRLVQALWRNRASAINQIERYVYLSKMKCRPFRMRTYFFHFAKKVRGRARLIRPDEVLKLWATSEFKSVTTDGFKKIVVKPNPEKGKEIEMGQDSQSTKYQELKRLAESAGGDFFKQFKILEVEAVFGRRMKAAITEALLNDPQNIVIPDGSEPKVAKVSDANKPPVNGETLQVQIDLVHAKAKGPKAYKKAEKKAVVALGLTGKKHRKSRFRTIGAYFARTQGKFRPDFIKRARAHFGDNPDLFLKLAKAYSEIEGKTLTAADLMEEGKAE